MNRTRVFAGLGAILGIIKTARADRWQLRSSVASLAAAVAICVLAAPATTV